MEDRPWCFVGDKAFEKIIEPCNIPKCSDSIWIYIYMTIGTLLCIFFIYVVISFFRRRENNGMTNIQNVRIASYTYGSTFLYCFPSSDKYT